MKLSDIARRMITAILIISAICLAGSVIYYHSLAFLPFLLGLVLGTGVSVGKVMLLERAVDKALAMDKGRAGTYVSMHHILRLLLTGALCLSQLWFLDQLVGRSCRHICLPDSPVYVQVFTKRC